VSNLLPEVETVTVLSIGAVHSNQIVEPKPEPPQTRFSPASSFAPVELPLHELGSEVIATASVPASLLGDAELNSAITDTADMTVTVHEPVPEHPPPDHPVKLEPTLAVAVSVWVELAVTVDEQVNPHEMPAVSDMTDPEPVPARETSTVCSEAFVASSTLILG